MLDVDNMVEDEKENENVMMGRWIAAEMDIKYNRLTRSDNWEEITRLSEDIVMLVSIRLKLKIKNELNE